MSNPENRYSPGKNTSVSSEPGNPLSLPGKNTNVSASEPRNPLYLLLLLASLLFVVTALAFAVVPVLEQKATDAGQPPPPSEFRDALRAQGGRWLLYELAAMTVLGLASMALDRLRSLQKERVEGKIPPANPGQTPSP
jgi:hypothetical protein